MPDTSHPTIGWRNRDTAGIVLIVTNRQKRAMAQRVAQARDAKGMTNESLARAANISVKTVSNFVNAKREPREHTIESLAKPLGMTAAEIRGLPLAPSHPAGAREDQVEDVRGQFEELVTEMTAAIEENQRTLAKILDNLVTKEMVEAAVRLAARPAPGAAKPSASSRGQDDPGSEKTG